jgi:RNA polymerase sigma-70 factor (ECF subfamily)
VQEVFLIIWEKKQQLIGSGELKFYLYTAVRNNCYTYLQKSKKNPVIAFAGQEIPADDPEPISEEVKEKDFDTLLAEALNRLPPKCREVFVLSRIDKLTYQQIANRQNISVKTVENQIGKALRVLRVFVKENRQNTIAIAIFFSSWIVK